MMQLNSRTPWVVLTAEPGSVAALSSASGLSPTIARLLVARGITDPGDAERFLSPALDRDWLDPEAIPGMS
jgi:single-stranded-DNA-specific exonuclease